MGSTEGSWCEGYKPGDSVVVAIIKTDASSYHYEEGTVLSQEEGVLLIQPKKGDTRWRVSSKSDADRCGLYLGALT